eukprot:scaffold1954_cov268-Pinguiococcus_pyrenoidosus.AAC.102
MPLTMAHSGGVCAAAKARFLPGHGRQLASETVDRRWAEGNAARSTEAIGSVSSPANLQRFSHLRRLCVLQCALSSWHLRVLKFHCPFEMNAKLPT